MEADLGDGDGLQPGSVGKVTFLDESSSDGEIDFIDDFFLRQNQTRYATARRSAFRRMRALYSSFDMSMVSPSSTPLGPSLSFSSDSTTTASVASSSGSLTPMGSHQNSQVCLVEPTAFPPGTFSCCSLVAGVTSTEMKEVKQKKDKKQKGTIRQSKREKNVIKTLHSAVHSAVGELEVFKHDLESCKRTLESKRQAIRILKHQMDSLREDKAEISRQLKEAEKEKDKEIRQLQCERDVLMNSQETWSSRFDRACEDNYDLKAEFSERTENLRKVKAEISTLLRERNELLAMVPPSEKDQWEADSVVSTSGAGWYPRVSQKAADLASRPPEGRAPVSAAELCMLGACRCGPEPCECARRAARLKKDLIRIRDMFTDEQKRTEEAYIVVDAYRMAFDEQLSRNRALTMKIAEFGATGNDRSTPLPAGQRMDRLKAVVKWVVKQIQEVDDCVLRPDMDEFVQPPDTSDYVGSSQACSSVRTSTASLVPEGFGNGTEGAFNGDVSTPSMPGETSPIGTDNSRTPSFSFPDDIATEHELVVLLLDMLSDKCEALANQRIASRLLMKRTKDLEAQLSNVTDPCDITSLCVDNN